MIILELPSAAGAHQLPVPPFAPDPKTKAFVQLIDLMPVPRPLQDSREIVVCHLDSLAKMPNFENARQIDVSTDSC